MAGLASNVFTGSHSFDEQLAFAKATAHLDQTQTAFKKAKLEYDKGTKVDYYQGVTPPPHMWDDSHHSTNPEIFTFPTGDDSVEALQTTLKDKNFGRFVEAAYEAPEGYAIRINPYTGKKEMMIAGTRHSTQWLLNAMDSGLYGGDKLMKTGANFVLDNTINRVTDPVGELLPKAHIKGVKLLENVDIPRKQKERYYTQIAKENNVDVVYGHSRGGAMVADMKLPKGTQKVGLDSAMLIAHHTGMKNLNEGGGWNPLGLFDRAIGLTGKDNVTFDASTFSPHKVWKT